MPKRRPGFAGSPEILDRRRHAGPLMALLALLLFCRPGLRAQDPPGPAQLRATAKALLKEGEGPQALSHFEQALRLAPSHLALGSDYRMAAIGLEQEERAIDFLSQLVKDHPEVVASRLNLAFAHVDRMPRVGTIRRGLLSRRSVKQFEKVLEREPDRWLAHFGIAMNYLHWPSLFNKLPLSIQSFQRCLKLQEKLPRQPHFVRAYVGLGDAFVRKGDLERARDVWRKGARLFPDHQGLKRRLALGGREIREYVDQERDLSRRVDTDLSALEEER